MVQSFHLQMLIEHERVFTNVNDVVSVDDVNVSCSMELLRISLHFSKK